MQRLLETGCKGTGVLSGPPEFGTLRTWEGIVPRKRRKQFEMFLTHEDPRVRQRAEEMRAEDAVVRNLLRREQTGAFWDGPELSLAENFDDDLDPTEDELCFPPPQHPADDEVPF